ncbi:hypothetical protein [Streptomyces nodosus]|uniref:hypothetical protein n=1 Tax=Streptomyces nodosus TaxID=40318 RepID=UPI0038282645
MSQPAEKSSRRVFSKVAVGILSLVVLAAGFGAWSYVDSVREGKNCNDLLGDKRVEKALGSGYQSDLSCAQLGNAVKRATMGSVAREHSLDQARSMQSLLTVMSEQVGENASELDVDLAVPFSDALADYAEDMDQILASVNVEYIRRDTSSTSPWQDEDGVHMAVSLEFLLQVMRSLSESSAAYAILRESITQEIAGRLAETSPDAEKEKLSLLANLSSRVLGNFDAVAEKARGEGEEAGVWDRDVLARLTKKRVTVPPYRKDGAGHLVASWDRKVRVEGKNGDALSLFEIQGTEMTRTWSTGMGLGRELSDSLVGDSLNSASRGRSSALRLLG